MIGEYHSWMEWLKAQLKVGVVVCRGNLMPVQEEGQLAVLQVDVDPHPVTLACRPTPTPP